jgi:hypothetical protein
MLKLRASSPNGELKTAFLMTTDSMGEGSSVF